MCTFSALISSVAGQRAHAVRCFAEIRIRNNRLRRRKIELWASIRTDISAHEKSMDANDELLRKKRAELREKTSGVVGSLNGNGGV
jgi:hypothetical protein